MNEGGKMNITSIHLAYSILKHSESYQIKNART